MSIYRSEDRSLPVRPNLDQLRIQAKDLLRAIRRAGPAAIEEFEHFHPEASRFQFNTTDKSAAPHLADAQLALARSYGAPSWPRLVQACKLIDAIWRDDVQTVAGIVKQNPQLVHENA